MPSTSPARRSWPVRIARHIPALVLEQPWALFVKSLCLVSGLTTFLGRPGSIEATFPGWVQLAWSLTLVCGAVAGLAGLLRPRWRSVEVAGLVWLGTAALVYGAAVLLRFRLEGVVAGSIVVAFGAAALVRALAVYVAWDIIERAANPMTPPGPPPRARP